VGDDGRGSYVPGHRRRQFAERRATLSGDVCATAAAERNMAEEAADIAGTAAETP
jgi:hypothetical protein